MPLNLIHSNVIRSNSYCLYPQCFNLMHLSYLIDSIFRNTSISFTDKYPCNTTNINKHPKDI